MYLYILIYFDFLYKCVLMCIGIFDFIYIMSCFYYFLRGGEGGVVC